MWHKGARYRAAIITMPREQCQLKHRLEFIAASSDFEAKGREEKGRGSHSFLFPPYWEHSLRGPEQAWGMPSVLFLLRSPVTSTTPTAISPFPTLICGDRGQWYPYSLLQPPNPLSELWILRYTLTTPHPVSPRSQS